MRAPRRGPLHHDRASVVGGSTWYTRGMSGAALGRARCCPSWRRAAALEELPGQREEKERDSSSRGTSLLEEPANVALRRLAWPRTRPTSPRCGRWPSRRQTRTERSSSTSARSASRSVSATSRPRPGRHSALLGLHHHRNCCWPTPTARPGRHCWKTSHAEAHHADLLARGVDTDSKVLHFEGAPPMFSLRDPDGNVLFVVEIMEQDS